MRRSGCTGRSKPARRATSAAQAPAQFTTLRVDTEPRVVEVPAPLAKALGKNKRAKAAWEKLSYSHQKEYADWIASAKRAETVEGRVQKTVVRILGQK